MEQAPYWMWAKRKQCLSSSGDSWEEQAFAEDSSGRLGGCIWPPRSYSCSFCRREFRSAQALGGHMNVHRRDRARLKQSPTEILHHDQINIPPCASLGGISGAQYPPTKASSSVYNSNTSTSNPATVVASSPPSPSRVSATSNNTQGNHSTEQTLIFPSYSSSSSIILQQHHHHRKGSLFSPPSGVFSVMDSEEINTPRNFNFVVHRSQPDGSGADHGGDKGDQEEEMAFIRKRQRSDDGSSLPFFVFNSSSVDRHLLQKEVLGLGKNSMEDIDLELRLGDGPKVK